MGANGNQILLWWGLLAPGFLTSGRDIWAQIGRGKVGLSGNILVKSNIAESKSDSIFDIRKSHRLYVRNIHLLVFSVQRLWRKGVFLLVPYFQNYDWLVPSWGSDISFLGTMIVFHS